MKIQEHILCDLLELRIASSREMNHSSSMCLSTFSLQDYAHWGIVDPLPSYGRGIDVPGGRYRSLITGNNLTDVVITGKEFLY